jgi:hypothetical protein
MCATTFVATACTYTVSIVLDSRDTVQVDVAAVATDMISVIYTVDIVLWIAFISVGYRLFKIEGGGQQRRNESEKILLRRLSLTVLILILNYITRGA